MRFLFGFCPRLPRPSLTPSSLCTERPKWKRTRFTQAQLRLLRAVRFVYEIPSAEDISSLSVLLDMPRRTIKIWFQNMRQRKTPFEVEDALNALSLYH